MDECADLLGSAEPLRQGDILEWLGDHADPWRQHAVIVTADCDIVHSKHAGLLACVPVLPYDAYMSLFLVSDRVTAMHQRIFQQIQAFVHKKQRENRPDFPEPMSAAAIDTWVSETSAQQILDALGAEKSRDRERFESLQYALRTLTHISEESQLSSQITGLAEAQVATGVQGTIAERRAILVREFFDRLKSLPGDAVFFHSLGRGNDLGYVAYLRVLLNVAEDAVATNVAEMRSGATQAKRIARLKSPFVFHLTQQLAYVFSAIGLPSAYEEQRAGFIEQHATSLGSTP